MNEIKIDWNSMARAYEEFNNAEDSYSFNIEWPCIKELLPDLNGRTVVDLGCGTGIFTFLLEKSLPSKLIGIDLSEEMLSIAKKKSDENNSNAVFVLHDAATCREVIKEPVDFIFSSTTSHYIGNLEQFFENVSSSLKNGGECIFSIIHPVYSAMYPIEHADGSYPEDEEWNVRYLDKSTRAYIQPWLEYNDDYENHLSKSFHHTFSDYTNAIIDAGLTIEKICEPMAPESWKDSQPYRYEGFIESPVYMILKMRKIC
ncbi:Methyltransferase domain-containing protein [Pseudobutyrivibrio sp. YE44]|uniref:class I SAM-dependent DNA methyltransferase n=1 Tax=Pseudobutyrivibrio sp. YE44 TaxID=1520802 RepID=UPI000889E9F2|nr:class I SAM-dependent methyltransferase [Pseudobutyrivibrio sp. YE44]SDB13621.1 Methyltransferase domain-containing protein [Pseudobutyrivibrio sp. YE44]